MHDPPSRVLHAGEEGTRTIRVAWVKVKPVGKLSAETLGAVVSWITRIASRIVESDPSSRRRVAAKVLKDGWVEERAQCASADVGQNRCSSVERNKR
jgi:hypothetical protein